MEYLEFLKSKNKTTVESGFEIQDEYLNAKLFEFQKFIVKKAIKAGKYAIFADCGLGKTFMQLEWASLVATQTQMPVLILAPLAVVGQTIKQGEMFGIEVFEYNFDATPCLNEPAIFITNYEQLENIDCSIFGGIALDESSILKNFEGATKELIIEKFLHTPCKLACTATPSPNDPMELGNHSEFLGVMTRNEMLAMYFVHDGGETAKWRIKGHALKQFYKFVGTWSIMLSKPSDIGFDMDGYALPVLNLVFTSNLGSLSFHVESLLDRLNAFSISNLIFLPPSLCSVQYLKNAVNVTLPYLSKNGSNDNPNSFLRSSKVFGVGDFSPILSLSFSLLLSLSL